MNVCHQFTFPNLAVILVKGFEGTNVVQHQTLGQHFCQDVHLPEVRRSWRNISEEVLVVLLLESIPMTRAGIRSVAVNVSVVIESFSVNKKKDLTTLVF